MISINRNKHPYLYELLEVEQDLPDFFTRQRIKSNEKIVSRLANYLEVYDRWLKKGKSSVAPLERLQLGIQYVQVSPQVLLQSLEKVGYSFPFAPHGTVIERGTGLFNKLVKALKVQDKNRHLLLFTNSGDSITEDTLVLPHEAGHAEQMLSRHNYRARDTNWMPSFSLIQKAQHLIPVNQRNLNKAQLEVRLRRFYSLAFWEIENGLNLTNAWFSNPRGLTIEHLETNAQYIYENYLRDIPIILDNDDNPPILGMK